ncbi:MAG: hypothetical protein PVJ86_12740 [Phycisphaerales bacterium]
MQVPQQLGVKTKQKLRRKWQKRAQEAKPEDESRAKTGIQAGGNAPRGDPAWRGEKGGRRAS